ncbi:hypothetical protein F5141DRAFT_393295 [Pisolithus sp. B1]|nr:hypothetical protein F5141DRAFT_393295 [Pisolithus sp. B1]
MSTWPALGACSSPISRQFQSGRLCAVLAPHCLHFLLPPLLTPTCWPPRRAFSETAHPPNHLLGYTSQLIVNEKLPPTPTRWATCRAFTAKAHPLSPLSDSLFHYTSGLWLYNNDLLPRRAHRVSSTSLSYVRLAAESVGRRRDDVAGLQKIAEGGVNRTFLITMHDGFQMVGTYPVPGYSSQVLRYR